MSEEHLIERHPDRIEIKDENGTTVARLGPTQFEDAILLAAAPALAALVRKAIDLVADQLNHEKQPVTQTAWLDLLSELSSVDLKGWELFTFRAYPLLQEVCRCDDLDLFVTDDEAIEHVRNLAARGDEDALKAIETHDRNVAEIARIRAEARAENEELAKALGL